jgi:hypothetical protein
MRDQQEQSGPAAIWTGVHPQTQLSSITFRF